MKIILPTSSHRITLRTYIDYRMAADDIGRCIVASGLKREQVLGLKPETIRFILHSFEAQMEKTDGELKRHVKVWKGMRSMRLSFIPSLESMTLGEHIDMDELATMVWKKNKWESLAQLVGIMYRPCAEKLGTWYKLQPYDSTKQPHAAFIEQLDMNTVNAALLFFSTILNELVIASSESLVQTATQMMTMEQG